MMLSILVGSRHAPLIQDNYSMICLLWGPSISIYVDQPKVSILDGIYLTLRWRKYCILYIYIFFILMNKKSINNFKSFNKLRYTVLIIHIYILFLELIKFLISLTFSYYSFLFLKIFL